MTRQQAHAYLSEAGRMNPGPWVGHSRHVALAAENIAKQIDRIQSSPTPWGCCTTSDVVKAFSS
jgi:hypothetical protein